MAKTDGKAAKKTRAKAAEPKFGGVRSLLDSSRLATTHRFEVVAGVLEEDSRRLVQDFFRFKREEG